MDFTTIRSHGTYTSNVDGEGRVLTDLERTITNYSCVQHPESLWTDTQWWMVYKHVREQHSGAQDGVPPAGPASITTVGDHVSASIVDHENGTT